jgi:hypothetical protein
MLLPGGESNTGLSRDRRGHSPQYYRGLLTIAFNTLQIGDISLA